MTREAAEHVEWEKFSRMKLSQVATIVAVTRSVRRDPTRRLATSEAWFRSVTHREYRVVLDVGDR